MFPKPVADTTLGQKVSFTITAGDQAAPSVQGYPCGYVVQYVRCTEITADLSRRSTRQPRASQFCS
jgi:hypothetical protein